MDAVDGDIGHAFPLSDGTENHLIVRSVHEIYRVKKVSGIPRST